MAPSEPPDTSPAPPPDAERPPSLPFAPPGPWLTATPRDDRPYPIVPSDVPAERPTAPAPSRGVTGLQLAIAVVGLLAGAALFLSGYSLGRQTATTPGTPVSEEQAFAPFWDAYRAVTEHYAGEPVDRKAIIEGAIRGMIEALGDPYSSYLSSEEYRRSLQGISGQFEGIGAEMGTRDPSGGTSGCAPLGEACLLVVVRPLEDSPAARAGIQAGDIVAAIDGRSVDGMSVDEAVSKVRGPKGTTVVLTVTRGDPPQTLEIPIVRDVIVEREVLTRTLAGGTVAYIRLKGFSETGAADVRAALVADIEAGRRKVILDLRGNPGGFVTAARNVASQFIDEGPIFWQEDARGTQTSTDAEPGGVAVDEAIKVVVLIDGGTASAAEIVAGALQDTGRATLVGESSFGKGTVQEWQALPDDTGGFRLTIARWLTPAKRWINGTGLTPDIPLDPAAAGAGGEEDPGIATALDLLDDGAGFLRRAA